MYGIQTWPSPQKKTAPEQANTCIRSRNCVICVKGLYQQALKLMSSPFTECVRAPTEMKSTPHSA